MVDQIQEEWDELFVDFKQLEADNKEYVQKLDELNSLQKKCVNHITHQRYRLGVMSKTLKELSLQKSIDRKKVQEVKNNIMKRKAQLYEIEERLPKPNGTYLKIILGNVNVSILNKEEKHK